MLANSHQLIVQLRIRHFNLLQFEDPLVATLSQLTLVFLQTLNNLQRKVSVLHKLHTLNWKDI